MPVPETYKTEVEARMERLQEQMDKALEEARAKREVNRMQNKFNLQQKLIENGQWEKDQITVENDRKLTAIVFAMEDMVDDYTYMPVYGFGSEVDRILGIARTILYTKTKKQEGIKEDLLALVGWTLADIEEVLVLLGSAPYYSKRENKIVEAVKPDIEGLKLKLLSLAAKLDLESVNLGLVTESNFERMYARAMATALETQDNTEKYGTPDAA
jgi:hypothetical protein